MALSHVLWANGRVLPLREISEAAHAVGAVVSSTVRRASARSTSIRLRSASTPTPGPGQKWLCGPNGVGFLWVAAGFEQQFEAAAPSYYSRDFRSEGSHSGRVPADTMAPRSRPPA